MQYGTGAMLIYELTLKKRTLELLVSQILASRVKNTQSPLFLILPLFRKRLKNTTPTGYISGFMKIFQNIKVSDSIWFRCHAVETESVVCQQCNTRCGAELSFMCKIAPLWLLMFSFTAIKRGLPTAFYHRYLKWFQP